MSPRLAAPVAFRLDATGPLSLPPDAPDEALWHALTHRVMRRPEHLAEHARRVRLCRRPALRGRAAGALADLLHVLDGRGQALAGRLLAGLGDALPDAERELLARWLAGEPPAEDRARALTGRALPTLAHQLGGRGRPDAAPTP